MAINVGAQHTVYSRYHRNADGVSFVLAKREQREAAVAPYGRALNAAASVERDKLRLRGVARENARSRFKRGSMQPVK